MCVHMRWYVEMSMRASVHGRGNQSTELDASKHSSPCSNSEMVLYH